MLRRWKTPLTLISHTQQDANTQDSKCKINASMKPSLFVTSFYTAFFSFFLTLSLAIRIT
jgi:hypothetical protein